MKRKVMFITVMLLAVMCLKNPLLADEVKIEDSFSEAIERIGSSERTLLVSDTQTISASLTVPSNVVLKFIDGGVLSIDSEVTLTINGPVDAPLRQIFSRTGKVVFGRNSPEKIYPQWWGAKGDGKTDDTSAIQKAIDSIPGGDGGGGLVFFPPGIYNVSSPIKLKQGLSLVGVHRVSKIVSSTSSILRSPDQEKFLSIGKIEDLRFTGPGKGTRKIGIDLTNVGYSVIRDVLIEYFGRGILMAGFSGYNKFYNLSVNWCKIGIEANDSTICNRIYNGVVSGNTIGILINSANDFAIFGMTMEAFGTGIKINRGDTIHLHHLYLESGTTAIDIGAGASKCTILNPRITNVKNYIIDKGVDTLRLDNFQK